MKSTPQEIAARVLARVSNISACDAVRWSGVSDEEWERVSRRVEEHNARVGFKEDRVRMVLDVTGKYSEYFTLWQFLPNAVYGRPYNFIKNVSKNLVKAVEETLEMYPRTFLTLADVEVLAWDPQVLKFGKYRARNIHDVFIEDPKYIVWLANQMRYGYDSYSGRRPAGSVVQEKMILALADAWKEELSDENEKYVDSVFLEGPVKDMEVTVDFIDVSTVTFGYGYNARQQNVVFIKGRSGDNVFVQFSCSGKAVELLKNLKKGDVVTIKKASIKDTVTKLGIKWNILTRVAV